MCWSSKLQLLSAIVCLFSMMSQYFDIFVHDAKCSGTEQWNKISFPFVNAIFLGYIWHNKQLLGTVNFALSFVAFSYHLLAATGTCARAGYSSETEGWVRTDSFILLFLHVKVVGTFQTIEICIDRLDLSKNQKHFKESRKAQSKASPRTLKTFGPCTWRNSKSTVERSFLAGYWSIIFITNIGMNRREKRVKGNTTKAGYIMMIQKIDLDVLPLTYT